MFPATVTTFFPSQTNHLIRITTILLLLLCQLPELLAQPDERGGVTRADTVIAGGNTYAIIIGISDYKLVPDLQYAHKDAQSFEDFLLSDAGGKVPRANIETFLNEQAVRSNVGDAISVIARKSKPGDRVWFFFAGHGDMEDLTQIENGLLLLHNSPNGNYFGMNDDVLEILDLKRYLSPLAQKGIEMIFIVDACHSGNLNGGVQGVQQTASALASSWGREYKILSCQPNQLSLESAEWGGGRGLFSIQMEEGIKGLADTDNDGKITMFELQSYIQANVAKFSEFKQIPLITGDLSKSFFKVNPTTLATLKKEKALNYPMLAKANTKGIEDKYVDSLTPEGKKLWFSYKENLNNKKLIWPRDTNALKDYRLFSNRFPDSRLVPIMRRNLASALNSGFDSIVSPLLRGETSYSSRDACFVAAVELDSCMNLLGDQHYMYQNLKARKLYMDAMSETWALGENEFNFTWRPTVETATKQLEESVSLEPNASYALLALGQHYYYLYEYEKANAAFTRYLELRPYDAFAKQSLGIMFLKLKQYAKAEAIFLSMMEKFPNLQFEYRAQLYDVYLKWEKYDKVLEIINSMLVTPGQKQYGLFYKGLYFARLNQLDSTVHYYREAEKEMGGQNILCVNNIGHTYFVHNQTDSARKYFNKVLELDSTYTFGHFNLGVIDALEGKEEAAILRFLKAIENAPGTVEGYVTNLPKYFGKKFDDSDKAASEEFKKQLFTYNMQYLSYLSILYVYIRVPGLIDSTRQVNFLFNQLAQYKQHEMLTWYHKACYFSMKKDKKLALASLLQALDLGFGSLYQIKYDHDLDFIRNTPEFATILKKYFPDQPASGIKSQ